MNDNEVTWTNEDVQLVEKFINIKNRGYYCSGGEVVSAYNRILHKNRASTNCSSCIRALISELENALNRFKKQMEINAPKEENKASEEPKKKVGRPPKKTE